MRHSWTSGRVAVCRRWRHAGSARVCAHSTTRRRASDDSSGRQLALQFALRIFMRQAISYSNRADRDDLPLVSVIIPAYNSAAHIRETLESVLSQTYHNFEVILINDGSPDTEEFECAIAPCRDRIVYIRQENGGPSAAHNAGIRRARGEYLAFLDSDDVWFPTCLAAQVDLALSRQPACDLVYSDVLVVPDSQQRPHRIPLTAGSRPASDAAVRGSNMAYGREALGKNRIVAGSLTDDNMKMLEAVVDVLRKLRKNLDLSASERSALQTRLADAKAQLDLERGKVLLLDDKYDQGVPRRSHICSVQYQIALRSVGAEGCITSDASGRGRMARDETTEVPALVMS